MLTRCIECVPLKALLVILIVKDSAQGRQGVAVESGARALWLSVLQRGTAAFHAPPPIMVELLPPTHGSYRLLQYATIPVPYRGACTEIIS